MIRKHSVKLLAGFFLFNLMAPLAAEEASKSKNYKLSGQATPEAAFPPVVAKVNGVDISLNRFWNRLLGSAGNPVLTALVDEILLEQEFNRLHGPKGGSGKKTKAQESLENEVDRKISDLKKQFSSEKAFTEQLKTSGVAMEDLKKQIRLELYKENLLGDKMKVTPAEVRKYFDENKEKLATPETIHLKHILVSSEQEAKDLQLALKVGANFDLLAKEKSKDLATKDKGGELGIFAPGMLIPEIEQKAFSLKTGETDIVKSNQGYHVIKVLEKKPAKEATWDAETRKAIEQLLRQAKFNQEYPNYIQALRAKADIKVFLNQ